MTIYNWASQVVKIFMIYIVKATVKSGLPVTTVPPIHMLAVFGKQLAGIMNGVELSSTPVHSLVFASHCTSLPRFPSPLVPTYYFSEKRSES